MAIEEPLYIVFFVEGEYDKLIEDIVVPSIRKTEPTISPETEMFILAGHFGPGCVDSTGSCLDWAGLTNYRPYKELMRLRIEKYEEVLQMLPIDSKVLFLDCDVIATSPFKQEILDYLEHYDFVMQADYIAGIWGVKNNTRTHEFFKHFRQIIDNIEPPDRPDGYPQFELEECINASIKEKKLSVLELPTSYGYLRIDNKIYHAINGGQSVDAKAVTLMGAAMIIMEMRLHNWKRWRQWEIDILKNPASKAHLVHMAAFLESNVDSINDIIANEDGSADWRRLPEEYYIDTTEIISTLYNSGQSIYIVNSLSFTPEEEVPRLASRLSKKIWNEWIHTLKS